MMPFIYLSKGLNGCQIQLSLRKLELKGVFS